MFCSVCKTEHDEKEFYGKKICYKCQYTIKIKIVKAERKCKMCDKTLDSSHWCYCSPKCAAAGKLKLNREYWTNLL